MNSRLLQPAPSPRRFLARLRPSRATAIAGKRILITGASSGIGRTGALRLAALGADVVLVARRGDELEQVREEIEQAGGKAHTFACDLTDSEAVTTLAAEIVDQWGGVDVLINNAGRSIRRTVIDSVDRRHDYERTMAVNYFGAVDLTLRLLPSMIQRGGGHILNVTTWSVTAGSMPKYSAYYASKAAVSAFGRSLGAELRGKGIAVTSVQYPLVRTPMSDVTSEYRSLAALTPEEAAEWLVTAIRTRPVSLYPRYAAVLRVIGFFSPAWVDRYLVASS